MSAIFSIDKSLAIDKEKIKRSFSQAAMTYDGLAGLQREVGRDLLKMFSLPKSSDIIVDIGCGTGFLTQELLLKLAFKQMIAIDIAWSMLQVTKAKLAHVNAVKFLCADAERLPLVAKSTDIIISNLALQWCTKLTDVFDGFSKALKPEGQVFFSTFGSTTLNELKQAWSEVDDYQHVNEFYTAAELYFFLQQSGFKNIQTETKVYQSNYQTVIELMKELKGIGANHVLAGRNKRTTSKTQMQNMLEAYEKFRVDGVIPASYEIIFATATR